MVIIVVDKFPLLPTEESERRDLLYKDYRSLSALFKDLVSRAEKFLQDAGITADVLITFFQSNSELTKLVNSVSHSDSIPEVMGKVRKGGYWNFLNCEFLESTIRHFDHEEIIIEGLEEYITNFQNYAQRRVCEVPVDAFDIDVSSSSEIVAKMNNTFSTSYSLSEIKQLQHSIQEILNLKLIVLTKVCMKDGCLECSFNYFNTDLSSVGEEQTARLIPKGVQSLTLSKNQNPSPTARGK